MSEMSNKRALLIRNAASYDFGGAERFVVDLAHELHELGWETTVMSAHKQVAAYAQERNIPFIRGKWLQSWQDWSGWRIALFPLYLAWQYSLIRQYTKVCKQLRPNVIHPQSRDDFIAATIVGKKLGITVIWTDHADLKYIYQNVPVPLKNPVGKWVWKISHKADAITLVSQSEKQLISQAVSQQLPAQYRVIYNGVVDTPVVPAPRDPADEHAIIFCATSRLVVAKGIGELIEAFNTVDQQVDARLWLIGDGPDAAQFKLQAKGNPHIVFWGFQTNVHPFVAASDVFTHPSYHEGFSISIIEAARLAKPMIACNVGGNPEIVHDNSNGILIPPKNAPALADAMLKLAKDTTLRTQYGDTARQTYTAQFEFDHIVKQGFVPLYEQ